MDDDETAPLTLDKLDWLFLIFVTLLFAIFEFTRSLVTLVKEFCKPRL